MEECISFNLSTEQIKEDGATHTTEEIFRQLDAGRDLFAGFFKVQEKYKGFLEYIYAKYDNISVIMTGAGTSAFIGDTLVPELSRLNKRNNVQFESIPTTDIVSNPTEYFSEDRPTILVSF